MFWATSIICKYVCTSKTEAYLSGIWGEAGAVYIYYFIDAKFSPFLSLARIVVLVLWSTISAITVTVISVTRSASLPSRHTCRRGQLICWKKVYWTSNEQIYYGELVALTLFMRIDQSNGASTNQSSTVQKKIEGLAFSIWTPCRWWYNISAKLAYHLISYLMNRRAEQRHESMTTQSIALSSW
jgi:hypothetical protein